MEIKKCVECHKVDKDMFNGLCFACDCLYELNRHLCETDTILIVDDINYKISCLQCDKMKLLHENKFCNDCDILNERMSLIQK